ncbi:shikimate dehydrogenase family protein [Rhizobium leguminosarum]
MQTNRTIEGDTRVVGIVADPIDHVQTPSLMNRLFAETNTNAVTIPLHVDTANFTSVVKSLASVQNIDGIIVTVPHKVAALALCDELGPAARKIGAVNAIRFGRGKISGEMFDGVGFVVGLRNQGVSLRSEMRVYLAGAGGAARAIAFSLLSGGVINLAIHNRDSIRAETLVRDLAEHHPSADLRIGSPDAFGYDLVINATSAGLRSDDPLPIDPRSLHRSATVVDIIMKPRTTPLLMAAQAIGCRVVVGESMLHAQIAALAAYVLGIPELGKWGPQGEE